MVKKDIDDVVISIDQDPPKPIAYSSNDKPTTGPKDTLPKDLQSGSSDDSQPSTTKADLQTVIFNKLGIANSSNPFVCIFHMGFKALAVVSYLFAGLILNTVMIFLLVSIFTVLDFWVVKNVSGR